MNESQVQVIKATHKGEWTPAGTDINIECYVLQNGERVFSLRGTASILMSA